MPNGEQLYPFAVTGEGGRMVDLGCGASLVLLAGGGEDRND